MDLFIEIKRNASEDCRELISWVKGGPQYSMAGLARCFRKTGSTLYCSGANLLGFPHL